MQTFRSATVLGAIFAASSIALPAVYAQGAQFSDRASFSAATSNLTNVSFSGYTHGGDTLFYPNGLTADGVTFTSPNGVEASSIGDGNGSQNPPAGFGVYIETQDRLDIALPAGTTAFGTDLAEVNNTAFNNTGYYGGSLIAEINDSRTLLFTFPDMNNAFVGFTSATPITSLRFIAPISGSTIAIDNVSYGSSTAPVPEMSSAVSLGGSLLGLSLLAFGTRKKKTVVSS